MTLLINCDNEQCPNKVRPNFGIIAPEGWTTLKIPKYLTELHFCSDECLSKYFKERPKSDVRE